MDSHTAPSLQPLPYNPSYEVEEEGEAETRAGLLETLHKISDIVYQDSGHARRSVHAKSHGLLVGQLRVLEGLPPDYAQGMFQGGASYPVVMRLSSTPGDMLDDKVSTPRGLALKVVGVPGERLSDGLGDVTQDFVMVNGSVFLAPGPKKFLGSLKLLAGTTDKAPGLKQALSAALRGTEKVIEAVGGESATIKSLGGHPETHVLGETYFTQVPILYGPYMAKLALFPVSPELKALTDAKVDLHDRPDGLRDAVIAHFARHGGEWELRVQLCTGLDEMPIEDASVEWPQEKSPYFPVARLTAQPQQAWNDGLARAIDDGMQFSPWHCLAAHRPIGSIMRVRQAAYRMSAGLRAQRNGAPLVEPRDIEEIKGLAAL